MVEYLGLHGWEGIGSFFTSDNNKKWTAEERKNKITKHIIFEQLQRTIRMFDWDIRCNGKTSTKITRRSLELLVQSNGLGGVVKVKDELYCLYGTLGGEPNWNYMPSKFIFANAFLNESRECDIYGIEKDRDVVIIPNDSLYRGMIPTIKFHAEQLTETYLTKRAVLIWLRANRLLTAPTSDAMDDLKDYLQDLELGKLASIYDKNFLKDIKDLGGDNSVRDVVTQILECLQYEKAALFNDCGLQMNYNMKRESITSSEAQLGEGALLPKPDDMMDMRKMAVKDIKDVFDETWTVEFSSAWKDLHQSINLEIQLEQAEVHSSEQPEADIDEQPEVQSNEQTETDGNEQSETEADEQLEVQSNEQTETDGNEQSEADADEQSEAGGDEQPETDKDEEGDKK